jgi:hypothetical protein
MRVQVLQQLRDGHTLLVTQARCQQHPDDGSLLVLWQEAGGSSSPASAAAEDLSCLPALLSTPCMQQLVDLRQPQHQLQQQHRGPLFVTGAISSCSNLATCHVHR